eukprot:TRINITY_DN8528_c0_g1_i1.p1 TRINITY_DN8528_c0_g1~~TRINITY_DN8528_c0_g1_i1.p1  ORF type:complete len:179 (-),score=39.94 TRINITY_DN8528_c0_g1_i1:42-578(-)
MPLESVTERNPEGGPILEAEEQIKHTEQNTALYFGELSKGNGNLYITTKHVIWLSVEDANLGYSMDYYHILIHAVSTDTSSFPFPCIYSQLSSDDEEYNECRFVPGNHSLDSVNLIYNAMCEGAALNPDPEEEGEGDFFYNENEVEGDDMDGVTDEVDNLTMDDRFEDNMDEDEGQGS